VHAHRGRASRGRRLFRCIQCPVASCSELRPHAYEVFRGLVDIDDFDVAAAVAGAPGSLKCMRRNSIIRARNSRIGGRVLPWLEYRAGNEQVRRVRLYRETYLLAADRRALHQPGLLMPCMDMRCFARGRPDNPQRRRRPRRRGDGRLGQPRSVVRSRQGNASATTRNDRECAMRASNAADRTSSVNDGTAGRVPGPSKNSRSDGARLWNRLYTLWRADRPAVCGRNAVVH
jgi:hypothetical protein